RREVAMSTEPKGLFDEPIAPQPPPQTKKAKPNGAADPEVIPFDRQKDEAVLDEFERLERENILDDDDGDEPGTREEAALILVVNKMPRFARFRVNPDTIFDMW